MKKSFHVFFLFVLFSLFAVNTAWAACPEDFQEDAVTGDCYVNLPTNGRLGIDVPTGLTSFKVYDDGGKDGIYSNDAEGMVLLYAPTGYVFQISGDIDIGDGARVSFVDQYEPAWKHYSCPSVCSERISYIVGSVLELHLTPGENNDSHAGFAFTVSVVEDLSYGIEIVEVSGGVVEAASTTAKLGSTVNLTITPDANNDYLFNGIKVVKKGTTEEISVNTTNVYAKTGGKASFTMPASDVTVTPSFAKIEYSVTVVSMNGGSVKVDNATTTYGETVSLTIVPTSGYHINSLAVKDAAENVVNVTLSNDKTKATFLMPKSNVTVTPSWNAELIEDGEGGYYVNMPVSGTNTLDLAEYIANGVTSFKVYDDGGKDGNFSSFVNGYLEMTAPAGYQFIIQGSMNTYCGDACVSGELNVFDGNASATRILRKWDNVSNINAHSSGNTMTLYFKYGSANYDYDTYSGLDFTVTVFTPHGVNIAGATGGKVSTDKETADEGTMVTLTATPNEGYMLNGISVVDIDGKSVDGTWNIGANTFTFNMPAEAVFVTPLFVPVGDVFVNIPKTGNMEVVIPEGMESIKVYDDGGKDGNYSDKSDAILQLTAPENYVFQISGSATTEVTYDDLEIFDGTNIADNFLLLKTINNGSVDLNGANILTSSNNVITIKFFSNDYINKSGFDLKVTLVKPSYGAVSIAKADDGKIHATINGDYSGNETLVISEAIEVDAIDYNREIDVETPVTALLPVTLPAGTTVNADFYTLEKVEQVEGMKWQATMTYIGKNNLPQPNTPYAVILPKGQTKLEFDLKGNKATVQTGKIKKVCGLSDCKLDENEQITDDWFFTGTYAYKQWNTGDEELGLAYAFAASDNPDGAAKGKFGKIKAGAFANATRCYLRKRDAKVKLQQQNQAQMVAASPYVARYSINNLPETIDVEFVKNDEKGGRTVLRGRMNTVTGEFKMLRDYDLKGRKVNGVNKARGAYYGKKVLKK